jgi:amino-acid N-acetyltransferase
MEIDCHPPMSHSLTGAIRPTGPADLAGVMRFLMAAGMPAIDRTDPVPAFWAASAGARTVGAVGLEYHGSTGLLRSLAVSAEARSRGLGTRLARHAEASAAAAGLSSLNVLTETAEDFFAQLGYRVLARRDLPAGIQASAEFRALCPASAICMEKSLT